MLGTTRLCITLLLSSFAVLAQGQITPTIVDIATRAETSQRLLVLAPQSPKAAVILFAGGHGGLQLRQDGSMQWGEGNFLVRTRQLFADQGLMVAVVDAPSDRQSAPYLSGFRQRSEHAADIRAVIAWARQQVKIPVWLVGTSRGTQSAAFVATELAGPDGPDGVVLTSTILTDKNSRPVPALPLDKLGIPVLVVHHEQDGCGHCAFTDIPSLMAKLQAAPRTQLLTFAGGQNTGNPCEARAYHGFNGLERDVVGKIADWITAK